MGSNNSKAPKKEKLVANVACEKNERNIDWMDPRISHYVWEMILDYITEPNDIHSTMNVCEHFHGILFKRRMNMILPLLFARGELSRQSVLNCREVSKDTKICIDKMLRNSRPSWLMNRFNFSSTLEINRFENQCAEYSLTRSLGKDFVLSFNVLNEETFSSYLGFMTNLGAYVQKMNVRISFEQLVIPHFRALIQLLNLAQNLKKLWLDYDQDFLLPDGWNAELYASYLLPVLDREAAQLPIMRSLTAIAFHTGQRTAINTLTRRTISHIIETYGQGISNLTISDCLIARDMGIGMSFWNHRLGNLEKLTLNFSSPAGREVSVLENLAESNLDNLFFLCFRGSLCLSNKLFRFLRNQQLTNLDFGHGLDLQNVGSDIAQMRSSLWRFEQMLTLQMPYYDSSSSHWISFSEWFPNLVVISFIPKSVWENGRRVTEKEPVGFAWLNKLFTIFSHLIYVRFLSSNGNGLLTTGKTFVRRENGDIVKMI